MWSSRQISHSHAMKKGGRSRHCENRNQEQSVKGVSLGGMGAWKYNVSGGSGGGTDGVYWMSSCRLLQEVDMESLNTMTRSVLVVENCPCRATMADKGS